MDLVAHVITLWCLARCVQMSICRIRIFVRKLQTLSSFLLNFGSKAVHNSHLSRKIFHFRRQIWFNEFQFQVLIRNCPSAVRSSSLINFYYTFTSFPRSRFIPRDPFLRHSLFQRFAYSIDYLWRSFSPGFWDFRQGWANFLSKIPFHLFGEIQVVTSSYIVAGPPVP